MEVSLLSTPMIDRPFLAATVSAYQIGGLIGRRMFFNYNPMYSEVDWWELLDVYRIDAVGLNGFSGERVVAVARGEFGREPQIEWELNPISKVLVQVTSAEWESVRYYPCGPYLSAWRWEPPCVRLPNHVSSPIYSTVETLTGDQFILPI